MPKETENWHAGPDLDGDVVGVITITALAIETAKSYDELIAIVLTELDGLRKTIVTEVVAQRLLRDAMKGD